MRILIVEDDGIIALFLKENVEELGHEVVDVFHDGREVERFERFDEIDLVLMDINIYGPKDGITLAKNILESHGVRSVFITSYRDSATLESSMEANPMWYLTKPVKTSDVQTILLMAQKSLPEESIQKQKAHEYPFASYVYDRKRNLVFEADEAVKLGKIELSIIALLIESKGHVVKNEIFLETFWSEDREGTKKLRDTMYRLRKKLPNAKLEAFSKIGYYLSEETEI